MKLDEHYMRLIAIGASVAANCQTCLEINLARARECGADDDELTQAIWVGRMVRRATGSKFDEFSGNLFKPAQSTVSGKDADKCCG